MVLFSVKPLEYFGVKTHIILQSNNGPCPFLALVNVLLLKCLISIPFDTKKIEFDELSHKITSLILNSKPNLKEDEIKSALIQLQDGINVDCGFNTIFDISVATGFGFYTHFEIPLVHGWIVSPLNVLYHSIMHRFTYNELMDRLAMLSEGIPNPVPGFGDLDVSADDLDLAKEFIEHYSNQLTEEGLVQLRNNLKDRDLSIFFYNNHFAVLLKHNNSLFCLVTDIGYYDKSCIWEELVNIKNDTIFYTDKFQLYTTDIDNAAGLAEKNNSDKDKRKKSFPKRWFSQSKQGNANRLSNCDDYAKGSGGKKSKCMMM